MASCWEAPGTSSGAETSKVANSEVGNMLGPVKSERRRGGDRRQKLRHIEQSRPMTKASDALMRVQYIRASSGGGSTGDGGDQPRADRRRRLQLKYTVLPRAQSIGILLFLSFVPVTRIYTSE